MNNQTREPVKCADCYHDWYHHLQIVDGRSGCKRCTCKWTSRKCRHAYIEWEATAQNAIEAAQEVDKVKVSLAWAAKMP